MKHIANISDVTLWSQDFDFASQPWQTTALHCTMTGAVEKNRVKMIPAAHLLCIWKMVVIGGKKGFTSMKLSLIKRSLCKRQCQLNGSSTRKRWQKKKVIFLTCHAITFAYGGGRISAGVSVSIKPHWFIAAESLPCSIFIHVWCHRLMC